MEKHQQSLEMKLVIHGSNTPHCDIAISLWNIGVVFHKQKRLNQASKYLEQSLDMLRIVHAGNSLHQDITALLFDLAYVYEDQGRQDEAVGGRERNESKYRETQSTRC